MGDYANDQIRADIKRMHGFDPGAIEDERRVHGKPVYKRVACPHCDKHPKELGLAQHIRDVHGIGAAKETP